MTPTRTRSRRTFLASLAVNVLLPLGLYYVVRAQGWAQWQALLASSALPAAHALLSAVRRRRAEVFDLFVVGLLVVSAAASLVSGDPRVLLIKDAVLPAALAIWLLGSLRFGSRPFTFHFGEQLRDASARQEAERLWDSSAEFRRALRGLTALWACGQFLDASLTLVEALTLPVDAAPLVGRLQSFALLGLVAFLTVRRSHAFRTRHGTALFGIRARPVPPVARAEPAGLS
ncbi:VC0807 family protein [Streptomyces gamaensis]|uniref:VC0807 family protein n=1 Tax=Streptomyces gamaensis TaxID=1763542 RepID=A0ABW0ZA72_9ACTN